MRLARMPVRVPALVHGLAFLLCILPCSGLASGLDTLTSPPFVGHPSVKLSSTSWSVRILPATLPAFSGPFLIHREQRTIVGAETGDSIYVVMPPAVDASGVRDPYTDTVWTWLIPGLTPIPRVGASIAAVTSDTSVVAIEQSVRWEMDSLYYFGDRGLPYNNSTEMTSGEGWYWNRLRAGFSVTAKISLPRFISTPQPSSLRLRLHSSSPASVTPTHAIVVSVNGQRLDTLRWNGYQSLIRTVNVPTALLVRGENTVALQSLPTGASVNEVYVDWFEFTAPQTLEPDAGVIRFVPPARLLGRSVQFSVLAAPVDTPLVFGVSPEGSIMRWFGASRSDSVWTFSDSVQASCSYIIVGQSAVQRAPLPPAAVVPDVRTNGTGADHVIVTPSLFAEAASRLALHRAAHSGLRVAVVRMEDVIDAFGEGRWGPDALRSFLRAIDTTWTAPAFGSVLLFGDGTWDPLDHFRTGKRGLIPTMGNPVSDAMFVVDSVDRFRQRKMIGRIPVRTVAQADSVVDALIAYDRQPITRWNSRFLFFASGFDPLETARFQQFSDALFASHLAPAPVSGTQGRLYRTADQVIEFEQTEEVRRTLDSGGVWINYYGHAGTDIWANGVSKADQLANVESKAHLITDISCSTARFGEPLVESFGELMVMSTTARALAYIGSSGFGYESPLCVIAQGFYRSFALGERRLGALHLAAKHELWKNGTSSLMTQQALHQWTLLGDPSAQLRIPRWPEYEIDPRTLVVVPAEPTESDSIVLVRVRVDNIGLTTADSVVVRLRLISESTESVFDTLIPAARRSNELAWNRPELRRPGFQSVTVTVNPDSLSSEESLSLNTAELRYVVASSRFVLMRPLEFSRTHPDSVQLTVLPPSLAGVGQSLTVEVDTVASFASSWRRQWSDIPLQPFSTRFDVPTGILGDGGRYWLRTKIVAGASATPWITRTIMTGTPATWLHNDLSGWNGTEQSGTLSAAGWALEERRVPVRAYSAGFSDGGEASVWLNDVNISQGFANRGYNIAVVNEVTGRLESFAAFSIYSDNTDTTLAEPLIQHLRTIPNGRRVIVGVADEGSKNKTNRLNLEFETIGSAQIRLLGWRGSWAISGRKGAPIGSVPEARSNEGQDPVTIFDTLEIRRDTGWVASPEIGPASRWTSIDASIDDTSASARVRLRAIRLTTSGILDTVDVEPGSSAPAAWDKRVRRIRLLGELSRTPGAPSPQLSAWSVQFDGLPEAAVSPNTIAVERDTVPAGLALRVQIPVANVGAVAVDSLPYRLRWRWPTGEVTSFATLTGVSPGKVDTIRVELPTTGIRGSVELEAVLDPGFTVDQWERGNDIVRRTFVVLPDTLRPRFNVTVDGQTIVNGDYVRPQPEIRIDIADDGEIPIASPSLVDLRLNGRRVSLSTATPDSSFESQWTEKKAVAILRPQLARGTHELSVQVTDGSGNPADTAAFILTFRVETTSKIRDLAPYPNPFAAATDLTFNLTGQSMPDEGSVRIYTVAGRLIREISIGAGQVRTGFNAIHWDGRDGDGDDVANGVYLAVLKLNAGGTWLQETAKLAKVR